MDFAFSAPGTRSIISKATVDGIVRYKVNFANFLLLMGSYGISGPSEYDIARDASQLEERFGARSQFGWKKIGEGAQFEVFASNFQKEVVLKRVKRAYLQDEEFSRAERLRRGLRALEIEIKSLGRTEIAHHPNIVDLDHWGIDWSSKDTHRPQPILCVERAAYALDILSETTLFFEDGISQFTGRYHLSLDVASGLQRLHDCEIVHGDLKPANVLIFRSEVPSQPWTAKLSDFGLSVEVEELKDSASFQYHGTLGWLPPEIENNPAMTMPLESLFKCDSYAFGLVALYIFYCWTGSTISARELCLLPDPEVMLKAAMDCMDESGIYNTSELLRAAEVCMVAVKSFLIRNPLLRQNVQPLLLKTSGSEYFEW
jgi:serine/threonine protein kinase